MLGALFIGAKRDGDGREIIFVEIWGKRYYVDETTELVRSYEERTSLPEEIGNLTGLTELKLSNNFGLLFGGVGGFPPNPRSG